MKSDIGPIGKYARRSAIIRIGSLVLVTRCVFIRMHAHIIRFWTFEFASMRLIQFAMMRKYPLQFADYR